MYSIFYEADEAINERGTSPIDENFKQIFNKVIDGIFKTDKELSSINKRIPKVEKMISKYKTLLYKYNNNSRFNQHLKDWGRVYVESLKYCLLLGPISGLAINIEGIIKAVELNKDYLDSMYNFDQTDLEYAIKKSEEALETLKERKKELENNKIKHEFASIFY
jgi:hypothetical protein